MEYNRRLWIESVHQALETVEAAGVTVIEPDKEPFRKAVEPMVEKYMNTELGDLIRQIREVR